MDDFDKGEALVPSSGMAPLFRLYELHRLLCDKLIERLEEENPKASMMNVARQFLKDNHIETEGEDSLVQGLRKLKGLGVEVPTFDDDDEEDDDSETRH